MFPIAHAYLMAKIFAEPTPALYLGCVWPDMLFNGPLTHHQTHRECLGLLEFAHREALDLVPFVRAALTHGAEPHGFDWYSDEAYDAGAERGYAFERVRPFVDEIVLATKVDPKIGLWKAHNFVEMTFEMALGHAAPHLGRSVAAACADTALVKQVTPLIARHFGCDAEHLAQNITNFPAVVALETPTFTDLAKTYGLQLRIKHGVNDADVPAMADIMERIWASIAPDRDAFLATAVREVAAMLATV